MTDTRVVTLSADHVKSLCVYLNEAIDISRELADIQVNQVGEISDWNLTKPLIERVYLASLVLGEALIGTPLEYGVNV